tara:strand:+ start:568 stop:996 length:429 start_codon:yes stop_codon:yes gene_type:complete
VRLHCERFNFFQKKSTKTLTGTICPRTVDPQATKENTMNAGQILISRWGYDHTNVDFHKVVSVTKSGRVRIAPMTSDHYAGPNEQTMRCLPGDVVEGFKPVLRKVQTCEFDGDEFVKLARWGRTAFVWDGEAALATDSRHGH